MFTGFFDLFWPIDLRSSDDLRKVVFNSAKDGGNKIATVSIILYFLNH